jgi:ABC-type sugar transport system permease subunit
VSAREPDPGNDIPVAATGVEAEVAVVARGRPQARSAARRAARDAVASWGGPHSGYWGFLFVLPILILFIVFKFGSIARAIWLSFTETSTLTRQETFVGLDNYISLFNDSQFLRALGVTMYYVIGTVVPLVVLSLLLAVLLNQKLPGRGIFRVIIFLPAVVPIIVVPILWRFLFHPYGLVNTARSLVLALVMTGGGPDNASRTLSLFIYEQGFRFFRLGYASAASMVLLLIIAGFTLINLRAFRTDD